MYQEDMVSQIQAACKLLKICDRSEDLERFVLYASIYAPT